MGTEVELSVAYPHCSSRGIGNPFDRETRAPVSPAGSWTDLPARRQQGSPAANASGLEDVVEGKGALYGSQQVGKPRDTSRPELLKL